LTYQTPFLERLPPDYHYLRGVDLFRLLAVLVAVVYGNVD